MLQNDKKWMQFLKTGVVIQYNEEMFKRGGFAMWEAPCEVKTETILEVVKPEVVDVVIDGLAEEPKKKMGRPKKNKE